MAELPPVEGATRFQLTQRLATEWSAVGNSSAVSAVPQSIRDDITESINSKTLSYRYVLPTHLLAKAVNPALDCRSIQKSSGLVVAFDARSICQSVIVPFDRQNDNVLGGSREPYANNPLRISAVVEDHRSAQRDGVGFERLCRVLQYAQDKPELVPDLLRIALRAIKDRLSTVQIVYPAPNRVAMESARTVVAGFRNVPTGGLRLQSLSVSLFRAIGELYGLFDSVTSNHVNAADVSTGQAADLECWRSEKIVIVVEVKDRPLSLQQVQDKLSTIRQKQIEEAIFLVDGGIVPADETAINNLIRKEFSSGQNIYVADFSVFLDQHLILFGERGRRRYLTLVGEQLDAERADLSHRQAWRDMLASI